ncbi:MAG: hypothetical protein AB1716_16310 [Planctomycetota bacterium]
MNQRFERFWPALESIPDLAAVPAEWRVLLGDEYDLIRPLLIPTPRLAGSVKSTAPGHYCVHEIRRYKGEYLAVCPDGCDTVTLTRDDIVIHKLNVPEFCRQLAEALGLEAAPAESLPHLPKVITIGAYVPYSGRRFTACLAVVGEPDEMRQTVDVLAKDGRPFILLVPTHGAFNRACAEGVNRTQSCFIVLAETLGLDDGGRLALLDGQTPATLFAEFRAMNKLDDAQSDAEFFPTPPGAQWGDLAIVFKDTHTVSVSVGGIQRVLNYTAMGMANRKNRNPNKQWDLLYQFALGSGRLVWRKNKHRSKYVSPEDLTDTQVVSRQRGGPRETMRKQKQLLAESLRQFFKIDGDPFVLSGGGGWSARFIVTAEEDRL